MNEAARLYQMGYKLTGQKWVDWMIPRVVEMCRVTEGLVCVNMSAQVRQHSYSPAVEWLVADLTRNHGLVLGPAPYVYFRFGIPGSGGRHYHRRDNEPVYCFCRPEVLPLKWSANTACGHPPRWAPGGECSNRRGDVTRVNQWGQTRKEGSRSRKPSGEMEGMNGRPSHVRTSNAESAAPGLFGEVEEPPPEGVHPLRAGGGRGKGIGREPDGERVKRVSKGPPATPHKKMYARNPGGDRDEGEYYVPPVLANPGNVIREKYDAEHVRQLLESFVSREIDQGDVIRCLVGGGAMGSKLAHESEAPFSETLVEFFVKSYVPPGGIVLDPFGGSGTTAAVAVRLGRRALLCDVRESQVEVARKRIAAETPDLFARGE